MTRERHGTEGLEDDLATQRAAFAGRAPAYDRICAILPEILAGASRAPLDALWRGRRFFAFYDRPLLLLASLRFDALGAGEGHPLWAALGAARPDPDAVSAAALAAALDRPAFRAAVATRAVQTNETMRAVVWLWPATLAAGRPLALVDLGCSAGLNLVADRLPAPWTDASGAALPVATGDPVVRRLGLDRAPLDATTEEGARWLRACVWAGDADRLARLDAAIAALRADGPRLEAMYAGEFPARLAGAAADAPPDALVVAYQSLLVEYLDAGEREAFETGMHGWLASLPSGRAVWLELELASDRTPEWPAAIVAHTAEGPLRLARCSYHPTALEVDEAAARELAVRLTRR